MQLPQIVKMRTIDPGQLAGLADLHEHAVAFVERAFAKNGAAPFLWIVKVRDMLIHVQGFWRNDAEKDPSAFLAATFANMLGAEAYSFITEAWIAANVDWDRQPAGWAPSKDPNREDVAMVITRGRDGENCQTRFGVRYSDRSRPKFGRLLPRDDWTGQATSFTGRMDLFSYEAPPADILAPLHEALGSARFGITFKEKARILFRVLATLIGEGVAIDERAAAEEADRAEAGLAVLVGALMAKAAR